MAQQVTPTSPSAELRTWSASRFGASGTSAERLKAQAIDQFCTDGEWVKAFVVEKIGEEIMLAITGMRRMESVKGPSQLNLMDMSSDAPSDGSEFDDQDPADDADQSAAVPDPTDGPAGGGNRIASRRAIAAEVAAEPEVPRWAKALAVSPTSRTFRPLLSLTREEILDGAEYLGARAEVLRTIAGKMKPGQVVRDIMDENELNALISRKTFRPLLVGKAG